MNAEITAVTSVLFVHISMDRVAVVVVANNFSKIDTLLGKGLF